MGLTVGVNLVLVATGLTLVFGMMGVINFAHSALFMLGAYVGLVGKRARRQHAANGGAAGRQNWPPCAGAGGWGAASPDRGAGITPTGIVRVGPA